VIARTWRGAVRTEDAPRYADYIRDTGLAAYASTPGNRGAWMLRRDLDDGLTEYVTFSLWDSMDAVRAFAGDDPERAVFYPEDDAFLVERDVHVRHYQVAHEAHPAA
jgi:heme-degrading monooxygenase HmoA